MQPIRIRSISRNLFVLLTLAFCGRAGIAEVIQVPADYSSIQEAIHAARNGDEIVVAPGRYRETISLLGKRIYLHSSDGADVTAIDGTNRFRSVISCTSGETRKTIIEGFTIVGGRGSAVKNTYAGGGLLIEFSNPTVRKCTFVNNAAKLGGAIAAYDSNPLVEDCLVRSNSAKAGSGIMILEGYGHLVNTRFEENYSAHGGAVYCERAEPIVDDCTFVNNTSGTKGAAVWLEFAGQPRFTRCEFADNSCPRRGGAVYVRSTTPTFTECDFTANRADRGGAIFHIDAHLTVMNSQFVENIATERILHGYGGAIHGESSDAVITDCRFERNVATSKGGAIYDNGSHSWIESCQFVQNESEIEGGGYGQSTYGQPLIRKCVFVENTSSHGGAISGSLGDPIIDRCVFLDNRANSYGGGVFANWGAEPQILQCLFVSNEAAFGGGVSVDNGRSLIVDGSTFYDNYSVVSGGGLFTGTFVPTVSNCIFRENDSEQIAGSASVSYSNIQGGYDGEGNIDADPMFVDPANGDFRLRPGSPCIDAGDNEAVPPDVTTDLDGNPRFVDSPWITDTGRGTAPIVDMGCYEYQASSGPVLHVYPKPLQSGARAAFRVHDARNNTMTFLVYSLRGEGATVIPPLNVTLDLRRPKPVDRPKRTDASGSTSWLLRIPKNAAGLDVWFQVAQQNVKTNFVETYVD